MDRRSTIFISVTVLLIFLFFVLIRQNTSNLYNWNENYEITNKEPYGTYVFHELMKGYFPESEFRILDRRLSESLPETTDEYSNYVFVGEGLYLDSASAERLLDFVADGNNAFISSKSVPQDLLTTYLYYDECNYNYWTGYDIYRDTGGLLNFDHPNLKQDTGYSYTYHRNHKSANYSWAYISNQYFCEEVTDFIPLGTFRDTLVNFVNIPYGDGQFYLHTSPLVFSNYFLIKKENWAYVNGLFAHLEEGDIYYDNVSSVPGYSPDIYDDTPDDNVHSRLSNETPLQYIISQDSLRNAWYLLLALTLLYLIFRAKRRQRIIPVLEKNTNTSLEYLETVGRLYFQQNDHRQLALQQYQLFLGFIRDRYNISTQKINDDFTLKLSNLSEIPHPQVEAIFKHQREIESASSIDEDKLIRFHLVVDRFYKNCK